MCISIVGRDSGTSGLGPIRVHSTQGPNGEDFIAINTVQLPPSNYDVTCGDLPISFNLTPKYDSVGACISDSIKTQCKNAGLTGRARASCNAAQIGNCHAAFFVPSNHNP